MFSVGFCLELGKICKNNDHTCLLHCINTCWVLRVMFHAYYTIFNVGANCYIWADFVKGRFYIHGSKWFWGELSSDRENT